MTTFFRAYARRQSATVSQVLDIPALIADITDSGAGVLLEILLQQLLVLITSALVIWAVIG